MVNPGDRVTVYQDPMTQHDLEGEAEVLEVLGTPDQFSRSEALQRVRVLFDGEDEFPVDRSLVIPVPEAR